MAQATRWAPAECATTTMWGWEEGEGEGGREVGGGMRRKGRGEVGGEGHVLSQTGADAGQAAVAPSCN